jgi:hypothetical protein
MKTSGRLNISSGFIARKSPATKLTPNTASFIPTRCHRCSPSTSNAAPTAKVPGSLKEKVLGPSSFSNHPVMM